MVRQHHRWWTRICKFQDSVKDRDSVDINLSKCWMKDGGAWHAAVHGVRVATGQQRQRWAIFTRSYKSLYYLLQLSFKDANCLFIIKKYSLVCRILNSKACQMKCTCSLFVCIWRASYLKECCMKLAIIFVLLSFFPKLSLLKVTISTECLFLFVNYACPMAGIGFYEPKRNTVGQK